MSKTGFFKFLLWSVALIILVSPLAYWSTGIGQAATNLSPALSRTTEGDLLSSPKAEALHSLLLTMRVQRIIIFPLLLLAFQLSGSAVKVRQLLENLVQPWVAGRLSGLTWLVRIRDAIARRLPQRWCNRLSGADLLIIWLFVIVFNMGIFLLYLPFNFYRSFVLMQQFGLSTISATGWVTDWGKSVLLNLAIEGTMLTGFFALMQLLPRRWPIVGGAFMLAAAVFLTLITPVVITPLFFTVTTLDDAELQARIFSLTERAGMPVDEIHVINASSKTTAVNAYVTGFGGAQRMVLYDTLLANYTPDQVEVVLAHELGHWYYKHVLLGLLGGAAVGWIGLFMLRWLLHKSWRWLNLNGPADVAGLPFILVVVSVATFLSLPLQNTISQIGEAQADDFALAISRKPAAFSELFQQMAVQNLAVVDTPLWENLLFKTHPSIAERVDKAEQFEAQHGAN